MISVLYMYDLMRSSNLKPDVKGRSKYATFGNM